MQTDPTQPSRTPTAPPTTPSVLPPSDFPVAVDERTPVSLDNPPPPISGGTLLIARDGRTAIASDPDRDRVVFVDLNERTVLGQYTLDSGAEPGRLVEDADGRVHVALRGTGKVASFEIATRDLLDERSVCGSPRGVTYDADNDALHVACMQGDLVTLPAAGGDETRRVQLGTDVRDIVQTPTGLRVSRFRSAELLEVDAAGELVGTHRLREVRQMQRDFIDGSLKERSFAPTLARRTLALDADRTLVLHERAMMDAVELEDPHAADSGDTLMDAPVAIPGGGDSAYGSAGGCTSIVQSALSVVDEQGTVEHSFSIAGMTLPVDVALSPDGRRVAIADAGLADPNAPSRNAFGAEGPFIGGFPGSGGVAIVELSDGSSMTTSDELGEICAGSGGFVTSAEPMQPIAVAYTQDGALVVQSREPATLNILANSADPIVIALGGESRADTGHDIFHRNAGASISCAGCHGEGGDDGHVWSFTTLGPRRTQSVNVGLEGTEPFHWSGDMANLPTLVSEVFGNRMGGAQQSIARVDALASWLFAQQAPQSLRAPDDAAALRGKHLFESRDAACSSCHSGSALTNNRTVDVGTGEPMQVPTLVGIAYRAPFIHTGCAQTLRDRFDPSCGGGDKHGKTSQLSSEQVDDLIAYLETL